MADRKKARRRLKLRTRKNSPRFRRPRFERLEERMLLTFFNCRYTWEECSNSTKEISTPEYYEDFDGDGVADGGLVPGVRVHCYDWNRYDPALEEWEELPDVWIEDGSYVYTVEVVQKTDDEGHTWCCASKDVYEETQSFTPGAGWMRTFPGGSNAAFQRASLIGHVFHDDNANGVRDLSESRGITGIVVGQDTNGNGKLYVADNPTSPLSQEEALTDEQGFFSFRQFPAPEAPDGDSVLWVEKGLNHEESFEKYKQTGFPDTIKPRSGQAIIGVDIGLFERATATGQIFNDLNGNGVKDSGETPSEFTFSIFFDLNGNGKWDSPDEPGTLSDSDGRYSLEGGEFGAVVTAKPNAAFSITQQETYEVTASGQKFENANFGIFRNVLLGGHVYLDMDGNGEQNHEPFLPGITVQLDLHNDGTIDATTTSEGAAGYYNFPRVGAGTHRIVPFLSGDTLTQPNDPNGYLVTTEYNTSRSKLNFGIVRRDIELIRFGSGDSPDLLELEYSIIRPASEGDLKEPLFVSLFASSDGQFDANDRQLGEKIRIEPSPYLPPFDLLSPGTHTIVIDPKGTPLQAALEDAGVDVVIAQLDPDDLIEDDPKNNTTAFRGVYQGTTSGRAVVRTGVDSTDSVNVLPNARVELDTGDFQETAQFSSPADMLIVTADGNDHIQADERDGKVETKLIVKAGDGFDMVFGGSGDDLLYAGDDLVTGETSDFNLLVGGDGADTLTGGNAKDVLLGDGYDADFTALTDFATDLAQYRFRVSTTLVPTGGGNDNLTGGDSFDVLIGGAGDDRLEGNGGVSNFLFGDAVQFPAGIDVDFAPVMDADLDKARELALAMVDVAVQLDDNLAIDAVGEGQDNIQSHGTIDLIVGGNGDDTILPLGLASVVYCGSGDDTMDASVNDAVVAFGGAGKDRLDGAGFFSLMSGGDPDANAPVDTTSEWDDVLNGGEGLNVLIGGDGDDLLQGGPSTDVLLGDSFDVDVPELIDFTLDLVQQRFRASIDIIPTGTGEDKLLGGAGIDVLIGGHGDDFLDGGGGVVNLMFGDAFQFHAGVDVDFAPILNEDLHDSKETALAMVDVAAQLKASVSLEAAGAGDDEIQAGGMIDFAVGGGGDDTILAFGLGSVLFGGAGNDTIDASASDAAVAFGGLDQDTLEGAKLFNLMWGDDLAFDNACISTSICDDTLNGGNGVNILIGGGGDDSLQGGPSVDVLLGDTYDLTLPQFKSYTLGMSDKRSIGFEFSIAGVGAGNDTLKGGDGVDILIGGDGHDRLESGLGMGLLFGDAVEFSAGHSIDLGPIDAKPTTPEQAKGITTNLWEILTSFFKLSGGGNDTIIGGDTVDIISGGDGDDHIDTGEALASLVYGNKGDDTILGKKTYFNVFVGGEGNDYLHAADSPYLLATASILIGDTFNVSGISPSLGLALDLSVPKLELSAGTGGLLSVGEGFDKLVAKQGSNVLIGGAGDDELVGKGVFNFMLGDSVNLGADLKLTLSGDPNDSFFKQQFRMPGLVGNGNDKIDGGDGVNVVIAGAGDDVVRGGNGLLDLVFGNSGSDTVHAAQGFNLLVGGNGDDKLYGGDQGNVILGDGYSAALGFIDIEAAKEFRLVTGTGLIAEGAGRDTIRAGAGHDLLMGGDGTDTIEGGDGMNIIFGDAMDLGSGVSIDFPRLFVSPREAVDIAYPFQLTGNGDDIITGGVNPDFIIAGDGYDTIKTKDSVDIVFGNGGKDVIETGAGHDVIFANDDDDCLDGGPAVDILRGGNGADRFVFSDPALEKGSFFGLVSLTDFDPTEGDVETQGCYVGPAAGEPADGEDPPTPPVAGSFAAGDAPQLNVTAASSFDEASEVWTYQYTVQNPSANADDGTSDMLFGYAVEVAEGADLDSIVTPDGWEVSYVAGHRQIHWTATLAEESIAPGESLEFGFTSPAAPAETLSNALIFTETESAVDTDLVVATTEGPYTAPTATNENPQAGSDQGETNREDPAVIDVLANDSDPDGILNPTSVDVTAQPEHGSVTIDPFSGQITFTANPGFAGTDTFHYVVRDLAGAQSEEAMVEISVDLWQNVGNRYDASCDGIVSPLDVLLIINEINQRKHSDRVTTELSAQADAGAPFFDIDGSGTATTLDVLLVISYINRQIVGGEGEAFADPRPSDQGLVLTNPLLIDPSRQVVVDGGWMNASTHGSGSASYGHGERGNNAVADPYFTVLAERNGLLNERPVSRPADHQTSNAVEDLEELLSDIVPDVSLIWQTGDDPIDSLIF